MRIFRSLCSNSEKHASGTRYLQRMLMRQCSQSYQEKLRAKLINHKFKTKQDLPSLQSRIKEETYSHRFRTKEGIFSHQFKTKEGTFSHRFKTKEETSSLQPKSKEVQSSHQATTTKLTRIKTKTATNHSVKDQIKTRFQAYGSPSDRRILELTGVQTKLGAI